MTVPPSQPELLEKAMLRILTDPKLRERLIAGGKALVKDNFDNSQWIQKLAEIFRRHNEKFWPR